LRLFRGCSKFPIYFSAADRMSTVAFVPLVCPEAGVTVSTATPLPVQAGRVALRRRFQKGTLIIRGKKPQLVQVSSIVVKRLIFVKRFNKPFGMK
jgi:hypothetical protein